jgi:hypothetical protein
VLVAKYVGSVRSPFYQEGELYQVRPVGSFAGVSYFVADDNGNEMEMGERMFKQAFEVIKQDASPTGKPSFGSIDIVPPGTEDGRVTEARAVNAVQRLLDGTQARRAMTESETFIRRETADHPLSVDVGELYGGGGAQTCTMYPREIRIITALRPGEDAGLHNGWKVRREANGFTFEGGSPRVHGFVDDRAISPFLYTD